MNRITALACPCVLLIAVATVTTAQETPTTSTPPPSELGSLKQAVEQQSKQIEALTQQVTELNRRLSTGQKETHASAPAPATPPPPAAPAQPQPPAQTQAPAASTAPTTPSTEAKTEQPAPEGGLKHTVAKGETLTSIAKRYNIPLGELEKFNKITDDRKLQIGHVLNIPTTANKAPEPPTEKKENP